MTIFAYRLDQKLNSNEEIDDSHVEYPHSDGAPVAESDFQLVWLVYFISALKARFAQVKDMYAAANMFVYFEKGNNKAVVAPDIFVVSGVENKYRYSFKVWEEGGKTPDFVIEILSKSTADIDKTSKMEIYAHLGVKEYILFDPTNLVLDPPFELYVLGEAGYQPVETARQPNGYHVFFSEVIGLELHLKRDDFRLYDRENGEYFASYEEQRTEIDKERKGRLEAEKRIVELEAELKRLRNGQ